MMPSFNSGFAADIRGMMEWRGGRSGIQNHAICSS